MALARYQATAQDDAGNILASPSVEVRLESSGALVPLFSDRNGGTALGNPFTGAVDGLVAFHVAGGAYKITFTKDAVTRTLRYVAIGTMAEYDDAPDDLTTYGRQGRAWVPSGGGGGGGPVIAEGGTTARSLEKHFGDALYADDFGAIGDGLADDTAAIQAAINQAIASGGGVVRFGAKTYRLNSTININGGSVALEGAGKISTILAFAPIIDNDIAIDISNGAAIVSWTRLKGFTLYTPDTTRTKTGIQASDVDFFEMVDIHINGTTSGLWGGGAGSIGVRIRGRDFITIRDTCQFHAEKPVIISVNPNNVIAFDHSWIGAYLNAAAGFPCITVDNTVYLSNATFSGAWVGGTFGFYFNDTSGTVAAHNVKFCNLRTEGGALATAYSIHFNPLNCNGLIIENAALDSARRGVFLRRCSIATIANSFYSGTTLEALNADNTVGALQLLDTFWNTGSTATIGAGLNLVYKTPNAPSSGPLPGTAYYSTATPNFTVETVTVNSAILPDTAGGANIGSATLGFAVAHLAAGAIVNWNNGAATITELSGKLTFNGAGGVEFNGPVIARGTQTNDNAAAGDIGEMIESEILSGGAVALTTGVPKDITSISLTAGDWDVWGQVSCLPAGTTTTSQTLGWIHTVSASFPVNPNKGAYVAFNAATSAGNGLFLPTGTRRISLAATTTVYLTGFVTFAVSTCSMHGYIGARRVR